MNSEPIDNQASQALVQKASLSWMTEKGLVKLRPRGLSLVTAILCADNLLSLGYTHPDQWNSAGKLVTLFLLKILWFWIFWCFWKGRNWARILTLISSFIIFLIPFFPHQHELTVMQIYMITATVFWAFLIYWLNTKPIVRFFKAPGNGISKLTPGS